VKIANKHQAVLLACAKMSLCLCVAAPGLAEAVWLNCISNCRGPAGCEASTSAGNSSAHQNDGESSGSRDGKTSQRIWSAAVIRKNGELSGGLAVRPLLIDRCIQRR
jgi:hypothetical protein